MPDVHLGALPASRPSVAGERTVGDATVTTTSEDQLAAQAADDTTATHDTADGSWFTGRSIAGLVGFLLVAAAAAYAGIRWQGDDPAAFYRSLDLPGFAPSADVLAPVLGLLFLLQALAAWVVWREWGWKGSKGALNLWVIQLLVGAAWVPVFFGMEDVLLGLVVLLLLLIAVISTITAFWRRSRLAALLMLPYGFWVAFALVLNGTIWWMSI